MPALMPGIWRSVNKKSPAACATRDDDQTLLRLMIRSAHVHTPLIAAKYRYEYVDSAANYDDVREKLAHQRHLRKQYFI